MSDEPIIELDKLRKARKERKASAASAADFSDDALALRFAAKHGADLRHVAEWGKWMQWMGNIWREDRTLAVFDDVRTLTRAAAADCEDKTATAIRSGKTTYAIERLSRSDRCVAAVSDQWDHGAETINFKRAP